jgi:hypothetical protein
VRYGGTIRLRFSLPLRSRRKGGDEPLRTSLELNGDSNYSGS